MNKKPKLIRITTIPGSLRGLLTGQLAFMSNHFDVIGISSKGEVLDEVGEREGVRVLPVDMTRTISPLKDLKAVVQLYKILKKEKPLIVHTHTPKAGTIGMLASKLAGVPYRLHTIAGLPLLEATGKKRKILDIVEKITYSCATKIYPNSSGLKSIILQNKYTKESKLKVIGKGSSNGIDTSIFNPELYRSNSKKELKQQLNISEKDFVFVFVGRIVKDKGINELIESFKELSQQFNNIKLLLVGSFDSNLDPLKVENQIELNNNPAIISVGYQKDVRPYFSISNVLTFPSYREGFPNVVLQAGAMNLNSIVTNINGCNEIIQDGYNGFVIPPKNKEQLFNKMKWLIENQEQNELMSANTRKNICDNYERKYIWNEILKEYNTIIK
ncbi:glycosyltransferase family 4 protein [uncultured Lacinutrix sp.]|uniref:glycosyltransferase family 4 protein n=1 Tax=uncultured Lacinutrix sp. TaxID=574032 RepID=UPI0026195E24|nr:glycosyltransferase family 4 protein [uncultured Lacinutrix sp.]